MGGWANPWWRSPRIQLNHQRSINFTTRSSGPAVSCHFPNELLRTSDPGLLAKTSSYIWKGSKGRPFRYFSWNPKAGGSTSCDLTGLPLTSHCKWPWVKSQIVPPVNIPIHTKIAKMGGEFTNPKWDPIGFDPQPDVPYGPCHARLRRKVRVVVLASFGSTSRSALWLCVKMGAGNNGNQ